MPAVVTGFECSNILDMRFFQSMNFIEENMIEVLVLHFEVFRLRGVVFLFHSEVCQTFESDGRFLNLYLVSDICGQLWPS